MVSVWLVWRGKPTEMELIAVCKDEHTAEAAVQEQVDWVTRYHGPHYPVHFDTSLLSPRQIITNYGEHIRWGEREIRQEP